MTDTVFIPTNQFQTPVTESLIASLDPWVREQFLDFMNNVPLLQWMISPDRPKAKDLPRDGDGKIIVDIAHPHILENTDFFRPAAKFYEENGCYTFLKPNPNPRSEYGKWIMEEAKRCREGYVRESDGEWIPGLMYWYLNYCRIKITKKDPKTGISAQIPGFPLFWEGVYYRFHYIDQARKAHKHCIELARRGAGKSYTLGGIMSHNLVLGENEFSKTEVTTILAGYTKEYLSQKDGTLDKFVKMKDFVASNTEFPRLLSTNRPSDMLWIAGRINSNGVNDGSKNSVMGVAVKDDEAKVRGKRGFILFEEMGSFKNLLATYNNTRDSVKDGEEVFALIYLVGTAGDKDSDFSGAREILYDPDAYEIYAIENVYDMSGKGRDKFGYFFPSYISRTGCMDKDGNSDVIKSILAILNNRNSVRKSKPETLLSVIAQRPITPEEAILRVRRGLFPTDLLNERLRQIDQSPHFYDKMYIGNLIESGGSVKFITTNDIPIREWPINKNHKNTIGVHGALEIFQMPAPGTENTPNRYVLGIDPVENDEEADSESLFSCVMFDLFQDIPVAEYTGRLPLNEDNCRMAWLMCRFYNAKCMPEANKKNVYAYFAKKHSLHMLADCPEYLKEREMVKYSTTGSSSKGVQALPAIIAFAQDLIRDWLLKETVEQQVDENGEVQTVLVPGAYRLWSRAMIQEMISYGGGANTDRVSALMQVMLYRHQYQILYGDGDEVQKTEPDDSDDDFFDKDWKRHLEKLGPQYKSTFDQ